MAETTQKQETGSLQDFNFDTDDSWFGQKVETDDATSQVIKEVKGADKVVSEEGSTGSATKTSTKAETLPEDEEEEELTFFETEEDKAKKETDKKKAKEEGVEDEEDEEVETPEDEAKDKGKQKPEKPTEEDDKFFTTLAGELKEKGIFQNVELKEGEEVTEDKFFELQDAEIEARVQETFEAFFEELDEDGKNFLKFKKAGGKTVDFFTAYGSQFDTSVDFDPENESQRNQVLTHYLSTHEKLDATDIEDRIKWLKESGKDKIYADKYFKSMQKAEETRKANLVKAREQEAQQREADMRAFNESLDAVLSKTENVGAFSFTKADQKELGSYVTKPTVKVGKNKYVPAFQAEIANIFRADTEENKQKLLLLAKLVKTNFDVTDLVSDVQTKVVKKAKSKLQEAKTGVKPASAGSASKKGLSDYF